MNLLNRIACSRGDPKRAQAARSLIYEQRLGELCRSMKRSKQKYLFNCLERPEAIASNIELRRQITGCLSVRLHRTEN